MSIDKPLTEKVITQQIRRYLKHIGFFHWKVWQGLGSVKGVSDIVGIKTVTLSDLIRMCQPSEKIGIFVAIEVKTAKGKLSEHQDNFIKNVKDAGGIAVVARSTDDVEGLR